MQIQLLQHFLATQWLARLAILLSLGLATPLVQAQAPELGQGWLAEFQLAERQTLSLAEAIPEDKFSWRPAEGVRSTSEVLMHVAVGNYWLLLQAGGEIPAGSPDLEPGLEEKVTRKADVIRWLKSSTTAVEEAYPKVNRNREVEFFGKETTSEGIFLRILAHNHEHMGQLIAYARMMGVRPPWSKSTGE